VTDTLYITMSALVADLFGGYLLKRGYIQRVGAIGFSIVNRGVP